MKALCIRQPWVAAILYCGKDIENRDWPTRFRGDVLLHASKRNVAYEMKLATQDICDIWNGAFAASGAIAPTIMRDQVHFGGVVGRARIVDCVTQSESPWFFGPYGFVLEDVEPLPFRPFRGALGFFDVPDEAWR